MIENSEIRIDGVVFDYRRRRALSGVSWSIGHGVTALLGPNGAGKTTLLKCIVGLLRPSEGSVYIDSLSMTDRRDRERTQRLVGYVPQRAQLPGFARVEDVIGYAAWLSGVEGQQFGDRCQLVLDELDLEELRRRRVRTLSGGQRQRVALATGTIHDPRVLILDEPTVGLDPRQRLKVRHAIQRIGSTRSVLLSTHMTEDVQYLADSVGVMVEGSIRYQGSLPGLVAQTSELQRAEGPGSDFEKSYESLMASLGADDE